MLNETTREEFIEVLRERDGELLRLLLNALSIDDSAEARLLEICLVRQPELCDLAAASERLACCDGALSPR
jgi:succinate dehydrogenase flavin-adding protein (antitoxin of CptAB toxin-antitoxin module)